MKKDFWPQSAVCLPIYRHLRLAELSTTFTFIKIVIFLLICLLVSLCASSSVTKISFQ